MHSTVTVLFMSGNMSLRPKLLPTGYMLVPKTTTAH